MSRTCLRYSKRYCKKKCVKFKKIEHLYLKSKAKKDEFYTRKKKSEILLAIALEKDGYCQFFKLSTRGRGLN